MKRILTAAIAALAFLSIGWAQSPPAPTLVSISISPSEPSVAAGVDINLTATGTYSDGSTQDLTGIVTWTSNNLAAAFVASGYPDAGLVYNTHRSIAFITAALGSIHASVPLFVGDAYPAILTLTPEYSSLQAGATESLDIWAVYSDGEEGDCGACSGYTVTSLDPTVATVSPVIEYGSQTGWAITAIRPGSVLITASFTDVFGDVGSGAVALNVTPAILNQISVTPQNRSIAAGTPLQFTATGIWTDNTTQDLTSSVTWSVDYTNVATVSNADGSQGLATGVGAGGTGVYASLNGTLGLDGSPLVGYDVLTVTNAALVSISVTPATPSIADGTTQQFTATGIFDDQSTQDLTPYVTWSSSATAAATISGTGLATGVAAGNTSISATFGAVTGSAPLTVTHGALVSIAVTPASPSIAKGTTQQFIATGTYADNTTQDLTASVTWSSSATGVAAISSAGLATSVDVGTTTINAVCGTVTGSASLTVTAAALVTISVTPANPTIAKGLTEQFTATGIYTDGSTQDLTSSVTWSSSMTGVAGVSNAAGSRGLATTLNTGGSTITATDVTTEISGSSTLTVTRASLKQITVLPANSSIAKGTSQQFTATGTYTDNTTKDLTSSVTWSSAITAAATISNAAGSRGLAVAVGVGATTIAAADPATSASGSTTLTVSAATLVSIAVAPANPSIPKGTTQQFTAIGTYTDGTNQDLSSTATWTSSATLVATISNATGTRGLAAAAGAGPTTITATDPASAIAGSTSLTVTPAALVSIAVTPANPSIAKGMTQQFTATGTYSDGSMQDLTSSVTWGSSVSAVATISNAAASHGLATGAGAGPAVITAIAGTVSGFTPLTVTLLSPSATFTLAPASAAYQSTFTVSATTNASTAAVIMSSGACSNNGTLVTMTSGAGTCQLTATWPADSNYLGATLTQSTAASKLAPALSWAAPAAIPFGSALGGSQLDASSNVPGSFAYTPAAGTVLPAGAGQQLSVVFTPADTLDYAAASASIAITINSGTTTPASLVVTNKMSRSNGVITVAVTISNAGGADASNVVLTTVTVGSTNASPLPQALGTISAGHSVTAIVTVPGSAGASGATAKLAIGGTYSGLSFTSTAPRALLP